MASGAQVGSLFGHFNKQMQCIDGSVGLYQAPDDCIVHEDVGVVHLIECCKGEVYLAEAGAGGEELVH